MPRNRRRKRSAPTPKGKGRRLNGTIPKSKPRRRRGYAPGLLGVVGGVAGGYFGGGPGALLGMKAGDYLGSITGMGDYKVNRNTLLTGSVPRFNSGSEYTTITHREYLGDVVSGVAGTFDIQEYTVNPSDQQTFPWLSGIAQQYESYEITGMIFEFKSLSGTAVGSTNTALGAVTMATVYDVLAPPFANRREMEQYEFSVSARTTENLMHPIECDPRLNVLPMLFTRDASGSNVRDKRFHDMANFYVATDGLQASNVTIGELWVSYRVRLFKPRHKAGATSIFRAACLEVPGGQSFNPAQYATDPLMSAGNIEFSNSTTIKLPGPGMYILTADACVASGTGTITVSSGFSNSTGATTPLGWFPRRLLVPTSAVLADFVHSSSTYAQANLVVEVLGADALVTLPIFSVGTVTTYDVVFTVIGLNTYTDTVGYNYSPYAYPVLTESAAETALRESKLRVLELATQLELLSTERDSFLVVDQTPG
jgi:hypothetical protein